jgi:hypothetical protein
MGTALLSKRFALARITSHWEWTIGSPKKKDEGE